jgi:hypothetical protein
MAARRAAACLLAAQCILAVAVVPSSWHTCRHLGAPLAHHSQAVGGGCCSTAMGRTTLSLRGGNELEYDPSRSGLYSLAPILSTLFCSKKENDHAFVSWDSFRDSRSWHWPYQRQARKSCRQEACEGLAGRAEWSDPREGEASETITSHCWARYVHTSDFVLPTLQLCISIQPIYCVFLQGMIAQEQD